MKTKIEVRIDIENDREEFMTKDIHKIYFVYEEPKYKFWNDYKIYFEIGKWRYYILEKQNADLNLRDIERIEKARRIVKDIEISSIPVFEFKREKCGFGYTDYEMFYPDGSETGFGDMLNDIMWVDRQAFTEFKRKML